GSILTLVATSRDIAWASTLLVVYAIGAALPMLAIAYGGQAATTRVRSIARYSPRLQQAFGAVVIAFALLSSFQYDTLIVAWLTGFYPQGQIGLSPTLMMETSMTIRSLATSASVMALCLIGAVNPGMTGDLTAPFAVAAVQGTAPDFVGI